MKAKIQNIRFELRYRKSRIAEKFAFAIAWKLPKWLVYFASIRLMAHATTGKYSNTVVPELSAMDALKRWDSA